jgi:class 3 adenylate cyclase
LILLGIALAGVLADFVIENDVATAATQPFALFGTTIELSTPALVAIAFGLGLLATLLVFAGVRRLRRGRRRLLQQRIEDLKDQNARLAVKRNLETVIRVPNAEPADPVEPPPRYPRSMPKLSATQRAKLPDRAFAYIASDGKRSLPINDEAHVRNALARFDRVRFESEEARDRARRRLLNAAKRYGIVPVGFVTGQLRSERRAPDLSSLPTGTVTFLLADIEGSTALLQRLGGAYATALRDVRSQIRSCVRRCGGHKVDAHGDEYLAVFARPGAALESAVDIQRALPAHAWPRGADVRVRIGVHTGRPTLTDDGYVGLALHTVARICAAGHGGQILVSTRTHDALPTPPAGVRLTPAGSPALPGIPKAEQLFQARADGLRSRFPALRR